MATLTAATATEIQTLYVAYFNRPADPLGLAAWQATGKSQAEIAEGFSASAEYSATYGGKTPFDLVNTIYLNLFGRPAEAAGLIHWATMLTNGTETFASIVLTIANSAQNDDLVAINNKVAAATAFTTDLDTAADLLGYDGAAANAVAKAWLATITTDASFTAGTTTAALQAVADAAASAHEGTQNTPMNITLTAGVDAGVAFTGGKGNDNFIGNATTLSALDQLDGGAGNDTLTLFSVDKDGASASLDLTLPTSVKNIENLVVTSTTTGLGNSGVANVSTWTGLTNASFAIKGGAALQSVTVADTTAATVKNVGVGGVTVVGGTNVSVTSGATGNSSGLVAAAATAVTAASDAVTANGAAATKETNYTAANAAAVTADGNTTNTGGSTTDLVAIKAAFAGAAGVTAGDIAAVNATTTDAAALALILSLKNGAITAHTTATAAVTTTSNASTAAAAAVVAEAAGAVIVTGGKGLVSATVVGGTTVGVTDSGAATLTTVSLSGNSGNATLAGDALTTVSISNTSAATSIANATAKHTLNLGVNAVTGGASITDNAATTVNLTVTGAKATTKSDINLVASAATALSVDTAAALTLTTTGLATADALKSLTVKGAGSLTADLSGIATLASVDLSAGSGKHTVTLDGTIAAATIKGGSGVDVVTVTGALDAKSNIALGAGNDVYKFTTAAATGAIVDGGTGTDTLSVNNGNLLNSSSAATYLGFEVLEVGGGQGTYDLSFLNLNAVTLTGTALAATTSIINATAATTLAVVASASTDFATTNALSYVLKDATGKADSLSLALTAVDGNNNGVAEGKVTLTSLTAAGIETVNIASTTTADVADADAGTSAVAAAKYVNSIGTLTIDATKLVLTGAASTSITSVVDATLTKIDASAATGDITFGGAITTNGSVTYLGGSGVDTYISSGKGDVISGGAGADLITLGAGKDTVVLAKASDSILTLKDTSVPADGIFDTKTGYDTITNFVSNEDKIDISTLNIATGGARGSIALHSATADTAAALQVTIGTGTGFFNDGIANRALSLVSAGGNSYLFVDANNDGNYTAGTDAVIKLVGITSLVLTDVAFG